MTDLERFQQLKAKVDSYNETIIANEVKKKNAEEELVRLMDDLKALGYSSVDEATNAMKQLEVEVTKSLDEMEAQLNAIQ